MKRIFTTERLRVRQLVPSDIDDFHALQSDREVMKYTGEALLTYEQCVVDLEKCIRAYDDNEQVFRVWAIEDKRSSRFIGTVALVQDTLGHPEIGFRILRDFWGNGYATEVIGGLGKYAFTELNKTVLVAYVIRDNKASIRVLEKNGFQTK